MFGMLRQAIDLHRGCRLVALTNALQLLLAGAQQKTYIAANRISAGVFDDVVMSVRAHVATMCNCRIDV